MNSAKFLHEYHPTSSITSRGLENVPSHRLQIGKYPTPLENWSFEFNGQGISMLIKRDDLCESTSGGNKLRKLEFILPDVLKGNHDWILSFGPLQSNSCRVVSAIAPKLGLRSAHVLVNDAAYDARRRVQGNLFLHKILDSKLFLVSRDEYLVTGQEKLLEEARERLIKDYNAVNPYVLSMGGSTLPGIFGYIECIRELEEQLEEIQIPIDEIFFACGSGGTAAGLAIGKFLSTSTFLKNTTLTGYIAWDALPEFFYDYVNKMLKGIGLSLEVKSENLLRFVEAKNLGYGLNSKEELELIRSVARTSGVVLDGTYTGKAVYGFLKEGRAKDKNCIFIHTGGLLSMMGNEKYIGNCNELETEILKQ